MNPAAVEQMNAKLGVAMDAPEVVARAVCELLERGRVEAVLGWPEKLFVRINALLPRLVDRALAAQLPIVREHAALRSGRHPGASAPINAGPLVTAESSEVPS